MASKSMKQFDGYLQKNHREYVKPIQSGIYLKASASEEKIKTILLRMLQKKHNTELEGEAATQHFRITIAKTHRIWARAFRYFSQFSFQYIPLLQFCSLFHTRESIFWTRQRKSSETRKNIYLAQYNLYDIITRRRKRHINIYIFTLNFSMVSVWLFYHLCLHIKWQATAHNNSIEFEANTTTVHAQWFIVQTSPSTECVCK